MQCKEALEHLADPFSTFSVAMTHEICTVLHIAFPDHLVVSWETAQEALYKFDTCATTMPGMGVLSLHLSCYAAQQLAIDISGSRHRNEVQQVRYNAQKLRRNSTCSQGKRKKSATTFSSCLL